jgi:hypothetical protein
LPLDGAQYKKVSRYKQQHSSEKMKRSKTEKKKHHPSILKRLKRLNNGKNQAKINVQTTT